MVVDPAFIDPPPDVPEVQKKPRRNRVIGLAAAGALLLAGSGWAIVRTFSAPAVAVKKDIPPPKVEPPPPAPEPESIVEPPPPEEPAPTLAEKPPPTRKLGGKQVVLEYDSRPKAAPAPSESPAPEPVAAPNDGDVARARAVYQGGNVKLFSGDASGAEAAYLEALKIYPGYVAGYRGLGFAYAEQGEIAKALTAFRLYVRTVPNARDTALIRKRIEKLEKQ